jgi:hypothetical protein
MRSKICGIRMADNEEGNVKNVVVKVTDKGIALV